jgi:hypothetical protein
MKSQLKYKLESESRTARAGPAKWLTVTEGVILVAKCAAW